MVRPKALIFLPWPALNFPVIGLPNLRPISLSSVLKYIQRKLKRETLDRYKMNQSASQESYLTPLLLYDGKPRVNLPFREQDDFSNNEKFAGDYAGGISDFDRSLFHGRLQTRWTMIRKGTAKHRLPAIPGD